MKAPSSSIFVSAASVYGCRGRPRNYWCPLVKTASRTASIHGSLYSNRVSFIKRAARRAGFCGNFYVKPEELQHFTSIQAAPTGAVLVHHPSRPAA